LTPPNPLVPGLTGWRIPNPALMVIFGSTGDLSRRKLLPSLYNLARQRLLPIGFAVVGAALDQISSQEFRRLAAESIREHSRTQPVDRHVLKAFVESLTYQPVDFNEPAGFEALRAHLEELDRQRHTGGNVVFYAAVPPPAYPALIERLSETGLARSSAGYRRIIIEKPFGSDLRSARSLNAKLLKVFPESSVYRIDHYLGKETVQNILAFRFANNVFEPIWNCHHVDSVQITVAEELGVEGRGAYYDQAGALRDIVQNHALQLLSLTAMEPPIDFEAQAVRDEKVKVLRAIRPLHGDEVARFTVRGQYRAGWVMGERVPGYRQEKSVAPNSQTETYAGVRFEIESWRWAQVPFYIRAGKRMPKRATEIRVQFKLPPHQLFGRRETRELEPNAVILRIQPEDGISLRFGAKMPGAELRIRSVNMDFLYSSSFLAEAPDAYERLLTDCMLGDATLFTRSDEVEAAWKLIDPIEVNWAKGRPDLAFYRAGTWGPKAADDLMAAEGRRWHNP
jgi:glucose-6-phosphate 1-dehydrogenase